MPTLSRMQSRALQPTIRWSSQSTVCSFKSLIHPNNHRALFDATHVNGMQLVTPCVLDWNSHSRFSGLDIGSGKDPDGPRSNMATEQGLIRSSFRAPRTDDSARHTRV